VAHDVSQDLYSIYSYKHYNIQKYLAVSTQCKVTSECLIEKIVIAAINDSDLRARLLEDLTEDVKKFLTENGFPANSANIRFVEEGAEYSENDAEVMAWTEIEDLGGTPCSTASGTSIPYSTLDSGASG
jgi:hypothetical protein